MCGLRFPKRAFSRRSKSAESKISFAGGRDSPKAAIRRASERTHEVVQIL
jgi:hypothetical protein